VAARKKYFRDALVEALSVLDPNEIKKQISEYVPADAQKLLAAAGLRDEFVFPLPALVEAKPTLVGYYRLLLGSPQKSFYNPSTGMAVFKSLEETGIASAKHKSQIPGFCIAMAEALSELVRQIPDFTDRDLQELPLLTFGSQLQGSNNTQIGKKAMQDLFVVITEILQHLKIQKEINSLTFTNASDRTVVIRLSADPDVCIQEHVENAIHNKVAIEVKGGTDASNAHNRAGEAEKSHQKAKQKGYREFWTIISKTGVDVDRLKQGSQTTTEWFDVTELLARKGHDWERFRQRLASAAGIPLKTQKLNSRKST
jgi:XcyI restriction endonuclease